jgi:hypothetical protein
MAYYFPYNEVPGLPYACAIEGTRHNKRQLLGIQPRDFLDSQFRDTVMVRGEARVILRDRGII